LDKEKTMRVNTITTPRHINVNAISFEAVGGEKYGIERALERIADEGIRVCRVHTEYMPGGYMVRCKVIPFSKASAIFKDKVVLYTGNIELVTGRVDPE
jgi:hypothetical protein